MQLDLGDAGCDVGTALLLSRDRLQLDRAEVPIKTLAPIRAPSRLCTPLLADGGKGDDRYGHSGATMILLAFRHGLRGCSGQSI